MIQIVWRAIFTALAVTALAVLAALNGPMLPVWILAASAAALIPVAIVDWWAVAIGIIAHRRRPDVEEVVTELDHMVRTASGGTIVAFLGASFLFGGLLPPGSGLMLLVAALLLFSGRPIIFIYRYYRNDRKR